MRKTKMAVLAAAMIACAAAPTANAADMCQTIKSAIRVGLKDPTFASLQSTPYVMGSGKGVLATTQIDGFTCKVSVEEGRGYYACGRSDANTGKTEAMALAPSLQHCLALAPTVNTGDYSVSYSYVWRADPKLLVYLSGSSGKLVFLNVVAYGAPNALPASPPPSSSSGGRNQH